MLQNFKHFHYLLYDNHAILPNKVIRARKICKRRICPRLYRFFLFYTGSSEGISLFLPQTQFTYGEKV